ncbi:hypothetical protein N0V93_008786 [Gnomoniopsis smithogilvyi]|uniref:Uncharacterized protein n=1 Tax=Gnomoniopsis smithogilvyi TaxID=1191159 RepID=A0A9W8YMB6_9PEZI|nr:hypothetical protein N0V93_008786 [Gnomoniopsis smithogilvyi]
MNPFDNIPLASSEAVASVVNLSTRINVAYPALVQDFETKYVDCKNSWFAGANKFSSNSASLASGPHFARLVALGPKVTPLVVSKLTLHDELFAIELYNKIERNPRYKADPRDLLEYNTLQRQANLIVDMIYERYNSINEAVKTWKNSMQKYYNLDSDEKDFANDEAYNNLIEFGKGAIAHVMLEWKTNTNEQANRLWEVVIDKIVNSEDTGVSNSGSLSWEKWSDWYGNKDYENTP